VKALSVFVFFCCQKSKEIKKSLLLFHERILYIYNERQHLKKRPI